jgi:hypothetical protein
MEVPQVWQLHEVEAAPRHDCDGPLVIPAINTAAAFLKKKCGRGAQALGFAESPPAGTVDGFFVWKAIKGQRAKQPKAPEP